jgi:hypothetical protein
MKITIWDILAIMTLFAVAVVGIIFLSIFANPYVAVNPFPPPTLPPTLALPSPSVTPRSLPATWTPTPGGIFQEPEPVDSGEMNLVATSTPLPTATDFSLPTFTPTLTFTITPSPTPTRTVDQADWIKQSPVDGTILSPGQDFDMVWTIKNTGINPWTPNYKYAFARGARVHKFDSSYTINRTVGVDETIDLLVDMEAPREPGGYTTVWRLLNDKGEAFYTFTFVFTVR